jgi:hypothetical protein
MGDKSTDLRGDSAAAGAPRGRCCVSPAISTLLVAISRPWKKSAAAIAPMFAFKNVDHGVGAPRFCAGSIPCAFRIVRIALGPIL